MPNNDELMTVWKSSLEGVADKIRSRSGTSSQLSFPQGFKDDIDNIPSGSYFGSDYPILDGDSHFWVDVWCRKTVEFAFKSSYTVTVDWGDNTTETLTGSSISHTYSDLGQYRIDISGEFGFSDNVNGVRQPLSISKQLLFAEIGNDYTTSSNRSVFYGWTTLEKICFNFGTNNTKNLGYDTFNSCTSLEEILVKSGKLGFNTAHGGYFHYCSCLRELDLDKIAIGQTITYFRNCESIYELDLRDTSATSVGDYGIAYCYNLSKLYLPNTITSMHQRALNANTQPMDIYVPWAEGTVANAPWGATNATIHYEWSE